MSGVVYGQGTAGEITWPNGLEEKTSHESISKELNALLIEEKQLHLYDDLTKVNPVTTETVLKCLQARYAEEVFYTNAGCTLVAVNPFQPVHKLYSHEVMKQYHIASHPQSCAPHIFTVAEQAYRNLQNQINPVNQSTIVSGESGAGKTWTSRCLMNFYATVAATSCSESSDLTVERIESRVLYSNPVMEAFGNACTLRNNNSSRFGKYIQLQLSRTQQIMGASIQTYLLENTRVVHQNSSERNFHIFYQIFKGASLHEREEWNLPENAKFCWLPNSEKKLEEDCFDVTKDAMLHLGIEKSTQNNMFKILAGLLHIGNLHFSESFDESQTCEVLSDAKEFIISASNMLNIPADHLLDRILVRTITAGKQQVFKKPCKKTECYTRRDCLAKTVYARLFDWLLTVINESICAEATRWTNFIGLLDVYGFESFPKNNLEQLCINYANEKLQQHFVSHYLKAQQEEYSAEGLKWSFISYQDNKNCVKLIDGSPVSIFSLLNEECRLNRPSDAGQLQSRLEKILSHNKCFGWDKCSEKPNFIISHYAGKVTYHIQHMAEKNKDPVPPELIQLLQESKNSLLQKLFPPDNNKYADVGTHRSVVTLVSKFKGSLESLMHILNNTTPHYIRCIKPNMDCEAMVFRKEEVLSQLEACGIVETIKISAAGFPLRISFESFVKRYGFIAPIHLRRKMQKEMNCPTAERIQGPVPVEGSDDLKLMSQNILHVVLPQLQLDTTSNNTLVHCGTTKVFLTHLMINVLEKQRDLALSRKAFCIQSCWRQHRHRKLARQRRAAMTLQAAVRGWLARKHIERMHKAADLIKRTWKNWKEQMEALAAWELDDSTEVMENTTLLMPDNVVNFPTTNSVQIKQLTTIAIFQSWILGFVLSRAPPMRKTVLAGGFNRHIHVLACLNALTRNNCYTLQTNRSENGITSIRATPQGSVKFHYKRSPLHFANICPAAFNCGLLGFNEILLEKKVN
ncbi:unconventional myosin-XIX [Pseudophryne corroboree]|uniref:unconventional myosin-XIX n=1 Tax=Pseudophryne corroboree TaxID=495146 RepID=UPI0030817EB5